MQEIGYLGHIISKDGIAVDQKKIEVMENFPAPTNLKEIRRFQDSPILLLLSLGLQSKILNSFGINIQKKHSKI